jgi:DNA-binding protein YbaB
LSNDGLRHQMTEVLALVGEQLADIAAMQKKQAELTVSSAAADGMVEVTVNAHGHVIKTVIDESYLDEYEFAELADHVTEAARAATREAGRRVTEMMAPISERRNALSSLSEVVEGAPDLRKLAPDGLDLFSVGGPRRDAGGDGGVGGDEAEFPTVRR